MKFLFYVALFGLFALAINQIECSPFAPPTRNVTTTPEPEDGENDIGPEAPNDDELPPGSILLPDDFKPGDPLPEEKGRDGLVRYVRRCIRYRYYCYYYRIGTAVLRRCYYTCIQYRIYVIP